ncbi:MAG: family 78 glycoside hydrolase catalytic domain [Clostridia bacterium]|nr:family 78 glycoside hydrolase catalytic domain [Clostridia bacterium]
MNNYNFTGKWIAATASLEDRFAPLFKKNFKIEKSVKTATLYICGLGFFEAKINGVLPDDSVLNPTHSQYSSTIYYRAFDVTALLRENENEITVELGNSFYNEPTTVWNWQIASWRNTPRLILDLVIEYTDNTTEIIKSDESFKVATNGIITKNSIYCGETHDMRNTDLVFKDVILAQAPTGKLTLQEAEPIRRIKEYKVKEIKKMSDGSYIVTAPEMITGWAKIRFDVPKDTEITVTYMEQLKKDGTFQKIGKGEGHDGNWWPENYIQHDTFISNGEECFFEPKFSYKGFKYIEIAGCSQNITSDDIVLYKVANDVDFISEFNCSNQLINDLHALMHRTILNNLQGKPTDTPVWEKNGWLGDLNCGLTSMMYNFDLKLFLESFTTTMNDCFNEFNSVPVMVPSANWGWQNSPVWNTAFVFTAEALLRFCDHKEFVKSIYENLVKFSKNQIEALRENEWVWGTKGLADWVAPVNSENEEVDPNTSEGAEICGTGFVYKMLESMLYISDILEIKENDELFKNARENIYKAFNEKFFNKEKNIYETTFWEQRGKRQKYRQTSNLIPLSFGLVPEEYKNAVFSNLVNDIKSKDYHLDTGCIGTKFILPVLLDNGEMTTAYKVLTATTYPSWGHWLTSGDDSAWESWETTTRSKDHYFLATYDEILFSHFAGICDIENGFLTFTIKPILDCGLDFVNCKIKTPQGILKVEWNKDENNSFKVNITIPEKSKVDIILKEKVNTTVTGGTYSWEV